MLFEKVYVKFNFPSEDKESIWIIYEKLKYTLQSDGGREEEALEEKEGTTI